MTDIDGLRNRGLGGVVRRGMTLDDFLKEHLRTQFDESEAAILQKIDDYIDSVDDVQEAKALIDEVTENMGAADLRFNVDADMLLWRVERLYSRLSVRVSKAYVSQRLAEHTHEDGFWERYREPVEGTREDRTAFARSRTKDSRYFYFFQYCIWTRLNNYLEQLKNIRWSLENTRKPFSG